MNSRTNAKPRHDDERLIDRADNQPPETLPAALAAADDIPTIVKADVEAVAEKAIFELDTFSRVPETIANDDIYQRVTTLVARINDILTDLDARRSKHKAPYLAAGKKIDEEFKITVKGGTDQAERVLKTELEDAHKKLKQLLSEYDTRRYQEEQAKRQAEAERLAEQAAKDGIVLDGSADNVTPIGSVRSAHGGMSVRKLVKTWTVVDEAKLPRSVLSVDPKKVQALIDAGATDIPGILIEEKVDTHVQRR